MANKPNAPENDTIPHGNNYVWCYRRQSFISTDVCMVQQERNGCFKEKCKGSAV